MKKTITSIIGATLLVAAGAGASYAGEISTPIIFLGSGTQLVCVGSNVSTGPITMTVKIVGGVSDATQTCNLAANDRNGCQAFLNGQLGHCRISVSTLT